MRVKHKHLQRHHRDQAPLLAETPIYKNFKTIREFDNEIIAPLHGFDSALDYYDRCSARQFLRNIETPCYIFQALDDPFMSPEVIPAESELSSSIQLDLSKYGGHLGFFMGGNLKDKQNYHLENVVKQWISV